MSAPAPASAHEPASKSSPQPSTAPAPPKLTHKPFPSITGSCMCNTVRYRLLTSPLFCYACHCPECQRFTGSAFSLLMQIETYNIQIISKVAPVLVQQTRCPGVVSKHFRCPVCKVDLWGNDILGIAIADLRVGTLDFPGLFEPDMHAFVESKIDWLVLPPGARTVPKSYNYKEVWPKSSLKRLDICLKRVAKAETSETAKAVLPGGDEMTRRADQTKLDDAADGEKTPTAMEFAEGEGEDDEVFEKRFQETEKVLQERLEKLKVKLEYEESKEQADLEKLTANLEIADSKAHKEEPAKGEEVQS